LGLFRGKIDWQGPCALLLMDLVAVIDWQGPCASLLMDLVAVQIQWGLLRARIDWRGPCALLFWCSIFVMDATVRLQAGTGLFRILELQDTAVSYLPYLGSFNVSTTRTPVNGLYQPGSNQGTLYYAS
jgi:hypothetical protein